VIALGVATVIVAALAVVGYSLHSLTASFADDAVAIEGQESLPPPELGSIEGPFDVMIVGTDECEPELAAALGDRCSGSDATGRLNDVNMLVHVSDSPRRVTVISFPRDLMIPIPSCTREDGTTTSAASKQPINSAYGSGGLACVVKTVSELSGQNIQYGAKVSFLNVINITTAIGGVEVCIGNDGIRDPYTGIDWPAGMRNVQGLDALQFLRTRHGVGDQSDLARIGNQQQYMSRLANKLVSDEVLTNPATLYKLATAAADNITPTESLANPLRIVQLALAAKDVPFDQITFVQYPIQTDPDNPNRVVPDRNAAQALWDALNTNQPIQLSGNAGSNGGVIDVTPTEQPVPSTSATPAPSESTVPTDDAVVLPDNINGSTADQQTCSAGNR
jgi:LCP family protein required for cell wall assembly